MQQVAAIFNNQRIVFVLIFYLLIYLLIKFIFLSIQFIYSFIYLFIYFILQIFKSLMIETVSNQQPLSTNFQ